MRPIYLFHVLTLSVACYTLAIPSGSFANILPPRFGRAGTSSLKTAANRLARTSATLTSPASLRLAAGPVDTPPLRSLAALTASVLQSSQIRSRRAHLPVLVQFDGPASPADRAALEKAGARVVGYVAPHGYLLDIPEQAVPALAHIPRLRWAGEYKPSYKLSPALSAARAAYFQCAARPALTNAFPATKKPPRELAPLAPPTLDSFTSVTIHLFSPDDIEETLHHLTALGARDLGAVAGGPPDSPWGRIRAQVPFTALDAIANLAPVQWIEPYSDPKLFNNLAVQPHLMNVTPVWSTNWLGLTGRGQIVAHADTGLDVGNFSNLNYDFTNRVHAVFTWGRPGVWSDPDGHGTHTAGSLAGNGSSYSNGLFKAPAYEVRLVHQSLYVNSSAPLGGVPTNLTLLFQQAYATNARIHSCSWGFSGHGDYTWAARDADEFMWNRPDMLLVFAAGNDSEDAGGTGVVNLQTIASPASAKNVLTVGAAESGRPPGSGGYTSRIYGSDDWEPWFPANPIHDDLVSTSADGIHQGMFAFSSRGPTADGRIKPDIVAPGTDIISVRSWAPGASTYWGLFNPRYSFMGGTSCSTPLTASAAALLRQYFIERHVPAISNPSAALLKATLLCGARSLSPGQYGYRQFREIPPPPRPNPVEGWGHVNLAASLSNLTVWDMQPLTSGATNLYHLTITETNALSVLLTWTDFPGTLGAAQTLVNDLDLLLITPDGLAHYPNGLSGPDRTNNVEGIDLASVPPGVCTVLVSGVVNMGLTQYFALAVRSAAPVLAQHAIESVSHEPKTVRSSDTPIVTAVVFTNASGLADASLLYRANGGPWLSLPLALDLPIERGGLYTNAIPSHPVGTFVEYFATATANDGASAASPTQSFHVADYIVCVWSGGTQTPPYATWDTAFSNIHEAIASPFVTEGFIILVTNGTYYSWHSGVGDGIIVNKGVHLLAPNGPAVTRVSGGFLARVFTIINAKAVVEGFSIVDGWAQSGQGVYGGGAFLLNGTLRGCHVYNNYTYDIDANGGGVALLDKGLVDACLIRDNYALGGWDASGGGALLSGRACLRSCALIANQANSGLNNASGGNVALIIGGFISNCTVVAGYAQQNYGGGVYIYCTGSVHNSIVYFNNNGNFSHNNEGNPYGPFFQWNYSCVTPLPSGAGVYGVSNFTSNPLLVNYSGYDVHLRPESPCRNAGQFLPWMTNAIDADRQPRIRAGAVDIGALEFGPFNVSFVATPQTGLTPLPVRFTAYPSGENTNLVLYAWDFNDDGSNDLVGFIYDRPTNSYPEGLFSPRLFASNELGEIATWQRENYIYAFDTNIHYVAHGGAHVWPFTSLARAATNVVDALAACISGHSVVISDGVYRLPFALSVDSGITIRGLNGRDRTILDGRGVDSCLTLASGALAEGLTLSNGYGDGGGVFFSQGGTLRNARITSCRTGYGGAGAYFYYGGTLENTEIINNYASVYGGGAMSWGGGIMRNCIIMNNRSGAHGGGVSTYPNPGFIIRNCLIVSNTAYSMGGGVSATADATIENCTIADNTSVAAEGGGLSIFDANVAVRNSIIYRNRALAKPTTDNWATNRVTSINFQNVCTFPRAGSNWLTNDPRFVNAPARNYRLRGDSPCINAAQTLSWMSSATDLDGLPRIRNGAPDLGAYELSTNGPLLRVTVSATDFNPLSYLDFGSVYIAATNSRSLCIRNVGGSALTGDIQNLSLPFWCGAPLTYVLGINSNRTLTFFFSPDLDLTYTNLVAFTGGGGALLTLTGTGIPEPTWLVLIGALLTLLPSRR
ncbi:MAG: S8 family serine peptidase [bacterium]|nr:S8 family serine peptidase [bacterium]